MIQSATQMIEDHLSLKFVSQVWDFWLDTWPCNTKNTKWWDGTKEGPFSSVIAYDDSIHLVIGRIISLDVFETIDNENNIIASNLSDYIVDTVSNKGRVAIKYGLSWPTTFLRPINGIHLRCTLGFGNTASVPANIKIAVMELAAYLFEHRGDETRIVPQNIMNIVSQYKEWKI